MMKPIFIDSKPSSMDRFGRQLAARLDASAQDLPHDISERLRVARLQALDQYRAAHVPVLAPVAVIGGNALLAGGGEERGGFWPQLVALIPLLAEIDAAILTDDLPPDAYADPGFAQFLKSRLAQTRPD